MQVENSRMIYRGADGLARAYRGDHIIVWEPGEHDYSKDYLTLRCISANTGNGRTMIVNVFGSPEYMYARMIRNGSSYIPDPLEMDGFVSTESGWLRYTGQIGGTCWLPFEPGDRILFQGLDGKTEFDSGSDITAYEVYGSLSKSFRTNMDFTDMFHFEPVVSAENLIIPAGVDCTYMFGACLSLEKPPKLPTTYSNNANYSFMFSGCLKMETAPDIPYSQLSSGKFQGMFYDCDKLNYVKCLATQVWHNATSAWLSGVAYNGTFVKSPNMNEWELDSPNGIPFGWTVVDAT